jgi:hypothetical protein
MDEWMGQMASAGDCMADGWQRVTPFVISVAFALIVAFSCTDDAAYAPGTLSSEPQASSTGEDGRSQESADGGKAVMEGE